ncbi:MAG: PD-(D/E)XK nuclease domain-containing protein [Candidatus Contendobacter sp.]|nr:PD-(D/E)XK nuclease domain-containing protein [Candidatus Contendobacter sp.]
MGAAAPQRVIRRPALADPAARRVIGPSIGSDSHAPAWESDPGATKARSYADADHIYLFEFKVVELEPEGRALQQIQERGYADKYRADGQPIHLIGVEFSREQRAVVGFKVETG